MPQLWAHTVVLALFIKEALSNLPELLLLLFCSLQFLHNLLLIFLTLLVDVKHVTNPYICSCAMVNALISVLRLHVFLNGSCCMFDLCIFTLNDMQDFWMVHVTKALGLDTLVDLHSEINSWPSLIPWGSAYFCSQHLPERKGFSSTVVSVCSNCVWSTAGGLAAWVVEVAHGSVYLPKLSVDAATVGL